ncbi:uncharacterized protein LOC135465792 isoform X2 [Liolophura sinensis]|uniref:uncharacterized protein LOC135465792 isoform X2 n=1 Tax=Liolophura sinensis TaxID=3198878 RepID=UPI0031584F5C
MNENYLAMTEGVKEFLMELGLEQYYEIFVTKGFDCESDVNNLQDDDLDAMEISDPNHRQLLLTAVTQLRKKRRLDDSSPEEPLVVGRWGKPSALVDAKYDFLCVEGVITSTKHPQNAKRIDFMVDSGSDVVTLREEVLESLDLELLGTVRSKGVHASREKRLYKAKLLIGSSQIEIEVMPESYDSLGSRVIRHFRHFIDGNRHVWLPGNYIEPPLVMNVDSSRGEGISTTGSSVLTTDSIHSEDIQTSLASIVQSADIPTALASTVQSPDIPTTSASTVHSADIQTTLKRTAQLADIPTALPNTVQSAVIPTALSNTVHSADIPTTLTSTVHSADISSTLTSIVHSADISTTLTKPSHSGDVTVTLVGSVLSEKILARSIAGSKTFAQYQSEEVKNSSGSPTETISSTPSSVCLSEFLQRMPSFGSAGDTIVQTDKPRADMNQLPIPQDDNSQPNIHTEEPS